MASSNPFMDIESVPSKSTASASSNPFMDIESPSTKKVDEESVGKKSTEAIVSTVATPGKFANSLVESVVPFAENIAGQAKGMTGAILSVAGGVREAAGSLSEDVASGDIFTDTKNSLNKAGRRYTKESERFGNVYEEGTNFLSPQTELGKRSLEYTERTLNFLTKPVKSAVKDYVTQGLGLSSEVSKPVEDIAELAVIGKAFESAGKGYSKGKNLVKEVATEKGLIKPSREGVKLTDQEIRDLRTIRKDERSARKEAGRVKAESRAQREKASAEEAARMEAQFEQDYPELSTKVAEDSVADINPFMEEVVKPTEKVYPAEDTTASVKMMITKADKAKLGELGYTADDIYKMKPEEAQTILESGTKSERSKIDQMTGLNVDEFAKDIPKDDNKIISFLEKKAYTERRAEHKVFSEATKNIIKGEDVTPEMRAEVTRVMGEARIAKWDIKAGKDITPEARKAAVDRYGEKAVTEWQAKSGTNVKLVESSKVPAISIDGKVYTESTKDGSWHDLVYEGLPRDAFVGAKEVKSGFANADGTEFIQKKVDLQGPRMKTESNVMTALDSGEVPLAEAMAYKTSAKNTVRVGLHTGKIEEGTPIRFTSAAELRTILNTDKLYVGKDFEGNGGISAQLAKAESDLVAYGPNNQVSIGILFPKNSIEGTGVQPNEVSIKPGTSVKDLRFIVGGLDEILSWDQVKNIDTKLKFEYGKEINNRANLVKDLETGKKESVIGKAWEILKSQQGAIILPQKPGFYSKLAEVANFKISGKADMSQIRKTMRNNGVTEDEMNLVLEGLSGKVTKQELLEHIAVNGTKFKDVVLGEPRVLKEGSLEKALIERAEMQYADGMRTPEEMQEVYQQHGTHAENPALYEQYTEPGYIPGSYRELFVTYDTAETRKATHTKHVPITTPEEAGLPTWQEVQERRIAFDAEVMALSLKYRIPEDEFVFDYLDTRNWAEEDKIAVARLEEEWHQLSDLDAWTAQEENWSPSIPGQRYNVETVEVDVPLWNDGHSSYDSIANPIVRIRYNERNIRGKRILFVEEIQGPSERNQTLMPPELVKRIYDIGVKRVLALAKQQGFDAVAWTTGKMQADRYSLSSVLSEVKVSRSEKGRLVELSTTGRPIDIEIDNKGIVIDSLESRLIGKPVTEILGKDLSAKIMQVDKEAKFTGLDLEVGGEGLKDLYDVRIPSLFKKYGRNEVESLDIATVDGKYRADRINRDILFEVLDENGTVVDEGIWDENLAARRAQEVGGTYRFENGDSAKAPDLTTKVSSISINDKTPIAYTLYSDPFGLQAIGDLISAGSAKVKEFVQDLRDAGILVDSYDPVTYGDRLPDFQKVGIPEEAPEMLNKRDASINAGNISPHTTYMTRFSLMDRPEIDLQKSNMTASQNTRNSAGYVKNALKGIENSYDNIVERVKPLFDKHRDLMDKFQTLNEQKRTLQRRLSKIPQSSTYNRLQRQAAKLGRERVRVQDRIDKHDSPEARDKFFLMREERIQKYKDVLSKMSNETSKLRKEGYQSALEKWKAHTYDAEGKSLVARAFRIDRAIEKRTAKMKEIEQGWQRVKDYTSLKNQIKKKQGQIESLYGDFKKMSDEFDPVLKELAGKYADVRVYLEASGELPEGIKLSENEKWSADQLRKYMEDRRDKLEELGIPVIKKKQYMTHLWRELLSDDTALKITDKFQKKPTLLSFMSRLPGSRPWIPSAHETMRAYVPIVEHKLAYQPFLNRWRPFVDQLKLPRLQKFMDDWIETNMTRRDIGPWEKLLNTGVAIEYARTIGLSLSVAMKHGMKLLGTPAEYGVLTTLKAIPQVALVPYQATMEFGQVKFDFFRKGCEKLGIAQEKDQLILFRHYIAQSDLVRMMSEIPQIQRLDNSVWSYKTPRGVKTASQAGDLVIKTAGRILSQPVKAVEALENGVSVIAGTLSGKSKGVDPLVIERRIWEAIFDVNFRAGVDQPLIQRRSTLARGLTMFQMTPLKLQERLYKWVHDSIAIKRKEDGTVEIGKRDAFGTHGGAKLCRFLILVGIAETIARENDTSVLGMAMAHLPILGEILEPVNYGWGFKIKGLPGNPPLKPMTASPITQYMYQISQSGIWEGTKEHLKGGFNFISKINKAAKEEYPTKYDSVKKYMLGLPRLIGENDLETQMEKQREERKEQKDVLTDLAARYARGEDKALDEFVDWVEKQPEEEQELLAARFEKTARIHTTQKHKWWQGLLSLSPERQAKVFYDRWLTSNEVTQDQMLEDAATIDAFKSERFEAALEKEIEAREANNL